MAGTSHRFPSRARSRRHLRKSSQARLWVEELEVRNLLSVGDLLVQPMLTAVPAVTNPNPPSTALTPTQIRHAYGFDQLSGDGSGRTIALVDAFYDASAYSDLQTFDSQFTLNDPTTFTQVDAHGNDPSGLTAADGNWALETALDIQWAHAMPRAPTSCSSSPRRRA